MQSTELARSYKVEDKTGEYPLFFKGLAILSAFSHGQSAAVGRKQPYTSLRPIRMLPAADTAVSSRSYGGQERPQIMPHPIFVVRCGAGSEH